MPGSPLMQLDPAEARILGSLIEKEFTTPATYPLTLNALADACNQKSNRDPIVTYDETVILRGIERLRQKRLVSTVTGAGIRVPKYKHGLREALELPPREVAILCLLLLRGPQTVGELRTRSGPLHAFANLEDAQSVLDALAADRVRPAMVTKLPRQPGQKEARYAHLLSGQPEAIGPEPGIPRAQEAQERIARIEEELSLLRAAVEEIRSQLRDFAKQFE